MVSYEVPVTGEEMVQTDLPYSNIIFNDKEGVLYNPQSDGKVIAEFSKTFNPTLNKNFAWDNVNVNWTRSAPATPLGGFKATFILEGILPNGQVEVVGERVVDVIPSAATTEDILFRLKSSRSMMSLTKSNVAISTPGTVMVNLPKRWFYYDSITLNMVCPAGWTRIVPLTFKGPSTTRTPGQVKKIQVPYDANMKSDFSDLRFLNSDGRSYLCMNIDSKVDSSHAYCTILVPTIDATPALKTIYMIYGNSSASAVTSGFTSEAIGSDEPDPFQVTIVEDLFTDESIDTSIWTSSIILAQTHISEHAGYLEIYKDNATAPPSGFTEDPIIYTSLEDGDWEAFVKIQNSTYVVNTEGGFFLMTNRSNVKQFKIWKYADTGLTYFQTPNGTNTAVTEGAYWLRIRYWGGTYYFAYSANSTDGKNGTWTTLYSTSSLGITPTYVGLYGHTWSHNYAANWMFDNFSLNKVLGVECNTSTSSIDPDTPLEDDTDITFTLPGDWISAMMGYLAVTEIRSTEHDTPDITIMDQDLLDLGYNGVDQYAAMRVRTIIEADTSCSVRINSMSYGFEV